MYCQESYHNTDIINYILQNTLDLNVIHKKGCIYLYSDIYKPRIIPVHLGLFVNRILMLLIANVFHKWT